MNKYILIIGALVLLLVSIIGGMYCNSQLQHAQPSTQTSEAITPAKPDIEILKYNDVNDRAANHVYVTIKNNSANLCKYVELKVNYYDANKNVVGQGMGNAVNIAAGQTRVINCMGLEIYGAKTYTVQLERKTF